MRISDWSSDVCSSDLLLVGLVAMDILADHAGAVAADSRRIIGFGEKLVELGVERIAAAEQADQPLDVVRHDPKCRPARRLLHPAILIGFGGKIDRALVRRRVCKYV